jgi:para-aminobenzoate synthetase/4-amino-4-deoxychorismate lyase
VHGRLRPGVGNAELVRATFPPCSVTGAPKIQAMRAIAELEAVGREVYTGALGYASPVGGLELSVAIRTFEAREERLWLDVGGAIVADSVAQRELEECLAKARPLVAASGAEIAPLPAALEAPPSVRQAPAPVQQAPGLPHRGSGHALPMPPAALCAERHRPDPALGVLETILVKAGQPCHLDEHLERLAGSLEALYGASLQPDLRERLVAGAAQAGDGALRVIAARTGQAEVTARPLPDRALPVRLSPFTLPGGLGAHKWADRRLLEALAGPAQTPLLLDADGSVLEAAWGNVWIRVGDSLLTPPADGRILPGVTRSAMLRGEGVGQLQAREEQIALADLVDADAVLVSSSLAATVPATLDRTGESPDG